VVAAAGAAAEGLVVAGVACAPAAGFRRRAECRDLLQAWVRGRAAVIAVGLGRVAVQSEVLDLVARRLLLDQVADRRGGLAKAERGRVDCQADCQQEVWPARGSVRVRVARAILLVGVRLLVNLVIS
jgi:hypothetical protein